ncbi:ATP-binding protein [Marinomonas sp.]|nr:ATP-binding protein [Marinomonas sp.]MDB4837271.1 ATP-binding protein [Marinomonas sp.]
MTRLAHSNFPFTAVAGQDRLKLALILCAINPQIGGVLISGPRGSAKSTLARGLADVMPALGEEDTIPFATLPLGTSEDRLLGALDLEQVLQEKQVAFKPGLLSRADGGVLYVDEVNLLADHLVDQLLDVAASGINRIERDGISHEHSSRFLLVGTMNPDEGELRPQLKDRFGLLVELGNVYSLEERIQIVRLREEFDQDSVSFCDAFKYKQRNLKNSIRLARQALNQVRCSDELRMEVAHRCHNANVDGVRGDIVWIRAAIAHAAWSGSKQVSIEDVLTVEDMVLAHRRQRQTNAPSSAPSRRPQSPSSQVPDVTNTPRSNASDFTNTTEPAHTSESKNTTEPNEQKTEGEWGSMAPQHQTSSAAITVKAQNGTANAAATVGTSREVAPGKLQGKSLGGYRPDENKKGNGVDWFRSVVRQPQQWPPTELTSKPSKTGQVTLHFILLDASASTLKQGGFAKAKGVILDIANQAYLAREHIAVFGFGEENVSSILAKVRAPKEISELIDGLEAGGGTPFKVAIQSASRYLLDQHKLNTNLLSYTYILTDGRTQADVSDISLQGNLALIDIENASIKRGRGVALAQQLSAQYIALETLSEAVL